MSSVGGGGLSSSEGTLIPIVYDAEVNRVRLLDQTRLPGEMVYEDASTAELAWSAIREMRVRGAPAIAVAAALGLACQLRSSSGRRAAGPTAESAASYIRQQLEYLETSRPTAVNLHNAVVSLTKVVEKEAEVAEESSPSQVIDAYVNAAEQLFRQDGEDNERLASFGAEYILRHVKPRGDRKKLRILTHCNTGALATTRHGTALGVIRTLFSSDSLEHVYATETRPYNQGARLTVFECVYEKIPVTLVVDSAVSSLLRSGQVDAVVVGADRVCANGDTANKIGTYQIALSCQYHKVPFFIAAPSTSIDLNLSSGDMVEIEERPEAEITHSQGKRVVVEGCSVWNPSFDVAPAELIQSIFTECGAVEKESNSLYSFDMAGFLRENLSSTD